MGKFKIHITKEELEELYVRQQLTTYQIAEMLGVSNVRVSQILEKFGIKTILKRRSFERNKLITFNKDEEQILYGGLFGDSYLDRSYDSKSARLRIAHCEKQKDYLEWKKNFISRVASDTKRYVDKKGFVSFNFSTKCIPALKAFYDDFYTEDKVKVVKRETLDKLSPLGLAIWFMDDGCKDKSNNKNILSTNGFTLQEQKIILDYFKTTWDIDGVIKHRVYPGNRIYYFLSFSTRNSRKITNIINPYVIESMKYKLVL